MPRIHDAGGELVNLGHWTEASVDVNAAAAADVEPAVAAAAGLRLCGYSCRESAGTPAAAEFNLVNGATVAGGQNTVSVALAASGTETQWFSDSGIDSANGISIDIVAGTIDILIYHKTVTA